MQPDSFVGRLSILIVKISAGIAQQPPRDSPSFFKIHSPRTDSS
jgi:hypothetical protein